MAQAMMSTGEGSQTTASEVKDIFSQIRTKADQELAELLKSVEQLPPSMLLEQKSFLSWFV